MTFTNKEEDEFWLALKFLVLGLFASSIPSFFAGVCVHSCYHKEIKKSVWIQAVERGYAEEIETSEGKVFIWKK